MHRGLGRVLFAQRGRFVHYLGTMTLCVRYFSTLRRDWVEFYDAAGQTYGQSTGTYIGYVRDCIKHSLFKIVRNPAKNNG